METGWVLYVLFAGLMIVFWRRAGGRKMEELFKESHRHHTRVLGVLSKHPRGGSWRRHRQWMDKKES